MRAGGKGGSLGENGSMDGWMDGVRKRMINKDLTKVDAEGKELQKNYFGLKNIY